MVIYILTTYTVRANQNTIREGQKLCVNKAVKLAKLVVGKFTDTETDVARTDQHK